MQRQVTELIMAIHTQDYKMGFWCRFNGVRRFQYWWASNKSNKNRFWNIDSTAGMSDFGDATSGGTMGGSTCESQQL